ncbi:MAG TPA: hypothetical protein VJH22_02795 [Candidatus Nanoarchaeia archaeon]|nr:hypothetical protein [Candidatus Nanoarchaeia archaeon]
MLFGLVKSREEILKDKILFTQKGRIQSLEHELDEVKRMVSSRDDEMKKHRGDFDRHKERLVDQIVGLSDKFADLNQRMLDIANENARMRVLLKSDKHSQVLLPKSTEDAAKEEIGKAMSEAKKGKKGRR